MISKLAWNWLSFLLKLYKGRHTELRAITAPSYKEPNKLSQQKTHLNLVTVTFLAM